jgi:hypothetical protein
MPIIVAAYKKIIWSFENIGKFPQIELTRLHKCVLKASHLKEMLRNSNKAG